MLEESIEEIAPVLRNMDANTLQWMSDERDRADQRTRELEASLGLALQAIKRLEARAQVYETYKLMEEPKKTPKQLCPTEAVVYTMENT